MRLKKINLDKTIVKIGKNLQGKSCVVAIHPDIEVGSGTDYLIKLLEYNRFFVDSFHNPNNLYASEHFWNSTITHYLVNNIGKIEVYEIVVD